MPTSDTWAGQSPMDSVSSVSIAGSSNTAFDEPLDYLSPDVRECLMFLEETIDSLDAEENNGVSTDELQQTEQSTKTDNMPEKSTMLHHELAYSQNTVPDGKIPRAFSPNNKNSTDSTSPQIVRAKSGALIPRAVSPSSNRNSIDSMSPQMVRAKSGANTLPKYSPKLSTESKSTLSSRVSESRSPIFSGDNRQRAHIGTVQQQLVELKDEKARLGPPTAPKPWKLPSNIILKSLPRNDGPMVSSTNSPNKMPKGVPRSNGHNLSRDNSTEEEAQHIRMEALAKLGLRSEPGDQTSNSASSRVLRTGSASNSPLVTVDNKSKTYQPEVKVKGTKTSHSRHSSIGFIPPLSHSAAIPVDPGTNGTPRKPAKVIVGNVNIAQSQFGPTKSSSLKRFTIAGVDIPPTVSLGYARNNLGTTSLNPGMSNTLPITKRSANVSEGQATNMNTAQWQFGATKASSLRRFGSDQPTLYSGTAQNTSVVAAAADPGLNKNNRLRPLSVCSEKDLSDRHGSTLEPISSDKPGRRLFPITINHISAKFQKSPPKGLNMQVAPQGPTSKDHREALRKLGLLKD
ncbi:specifically androgen-regulated gene protein [Scyliorhinus canicula]|uniref:specifically androgen-regulated gene protein n=1 Tax=Scyliorhinus canicula TaxID=7830 RepID=UPI0018F447C6|nr:specifically androgen-regulated gene protein [Scyliorhinus canicula]XP_038676903.1 specifically androgen-regulated gene protein [Scyliorhinus canicula]XP_038676904.1 specifically androgen-regulated gene protein [Scyliorhinus canicula]